MRVVAGIARFHGRSYRLGLALLVQQLDECVVALFKFGRFDRLHGRDARSKSKFSIAVAAVVVAAVVVAAVAAVTVAAVTVAKVSVTASIGMQARHGCRRFSFGQ